MHKFFYKIWSKFLTAVGDIKWFKWPFWILYDPDEYSVHGKDMMDILDIIQPGDIILRGYKHYVDGFFIKLFSIDTSESAIGGEWSHGAIYVGNNRIVHAIAEGVSEIDLLDFCKCDRIAIFRPKKYKRQAIAAAKKFLREKVPYDFNFTYGSSALYCFELAALSYAKLDIPTFSFKKFFGLVKKEDVYLAKSFIDSKDVELIYCCNPKFGISFKR